MYSVVLATMLAAGSTTPAWHCHRSCHTCYAGYSSYSGYSCYSGYACSCSCYSGCHGCHRIFPIFHRHHCHSCYSSCYGCTGYVYYGCYSCSYCSGCTICCGGTVVVCSAPVCCGGAVSQPKVVPVPGKDDQNDQKKKKVGSEEEVSIPANVARVTVQLPSDARLWIENVECPLTSDVRAFNTPALNPNQRYFYNVRAEIVRDGRTISETQRVIITPGQESRVDFNTSNVIGTAAR